MVIPAVPGAAHQRRCADAESGADVRPRIQWPASSGRPKCRERATYVRGPGRCEPPAGRRRRNNGPGCEAKSRDVRGSLADRIKGGRKKRLRDHARRNFGVLNDLGRGLVALPALLFGLGMLCSDALIPTTFSLAASRLPAADLPQAFRVLAVALVPASWLVLAPASFAKASPRARSPRSGQTAVSVSTVEDAHGSCNSQGKSSGRMLVAFSSGVIKTRTRRLPASLSSSPEQDRETNGLIRRVGNKNPGRCSPNDRLLQNKTETQTVSLTRREQDTH